MKKNIKRALSYLLTAVMFFTGLPMNEAYVSAAPEENDPNAPWTEYAATEVKPNEEGVYEISTAEELAWLAKEVNLGYDSNLEQYDYDWESDSYTYTTFRLTNDIDLSAHEWVPIGTANNAEFKGIFDGAGYTITGMHVGTKDAPYNAGYYAGLFGRLYSGGSVTDVKLIDPVIYAASPESGDECYTGLIAGYQGGSKSVISNCEVSGSAFIIGNKEYGRYYGDAGGIVGSLYQGTIDSCRANVILGALDGERKYSLGGIAGVAGYYNSCAIKNCVSVVTADIPNDLIRDYYVDGLSAGGSRCTISNSIAQVDYDSSNFNYKDYSNNVPGTRKNVAMIVTNIANRQYSEVEPYEYLGSEAREPRYIYHDGNGELTEKTEDELKNEECIETLNAAARDIEGALPWTISEDENGGYPNLKGAGLHRFIVVDFVSAGETYKTDRIISGKTVAEPKAPERDGYTFDYWYAEDKDKAYDFSTPVTDELTLNAKWIPHVYSVRFDSKGGSYVYPQNVERDTKATAPTEPEKKGYSFGGWFTDSECKNAWSFDSLITEDTVLYAGWTEASDLAVSGRITDEDGRGIQGATVTLENGQNARTDEFGYYRLNNVAQGTYSITASAPGYNSATQAGFVVNDISSGYDVALTKQNEGSQAGTVDIYTTVSCVYSGLMLEGVEVRAVGAGDLGEYKMTTDANGFVFFTGLPVGTYTFHINENGRPGWESYVSDPKELTTSYNLRCALKPNYQKLSVKVLGDYDPITEEANVPLENTKVKLLGVDPKNEDKVLINREISTDENGVLTVDNLVPITWKISASEFAYEETETTIYSNGAGKLSKNEVTLTLPFINSSLTVGLESVYEDPDIFKASKDGTPATLKIELAGTAGTLSEGIIRESALNEQGKAVFNKILPGTYQMTVSGAAKRYVSVTSGDGKELDASYSGGKKYFEVDFDGHDTTNVGLGQNVEATLKVTPSPVSFSGTLFKSDMGEDGNVTTVPLANTKLTIKPSEYYKMNDEASEGIEITTDEEGHYAASLWPGLYGVEIEDTYATSYTGGTITYYEGMTAEWSKGYEGGYPVGWPNADKWTGSYESANAWLSGKYGMGGDIGGMSLSSGSVVADLTIQEKEVKFSFNKPSVNPAALTYMITGIDKKEKEGPYMLGGSYSREDPFFYNMHWVHSYQTVDYHPETRGATMTVRKNGKSETIDLTDKSFPLDYYNLVPGNYTFSYEMSSVLFPHLEATGINGTAKSFTFFDFPAPGKLPTNFPEDYNNKSNPWPLDQVIDDGVIIDARNKKDSNGNKQYRMVSDLYDGDESNGEIKVKFYHLNEYMPSYADYGNAPAKPDPSYKPRSADSSSATNNVYQGSVPAESYQANVYYAASIGDNTVWSGIPSSKWSEVKDGFDADSDLHWRWNTGELGKSIDEAVYNDSNKPTKDQYYELVSGHDYNYRNYYSNSYTTPESEKVEEVVHGYKAGSVVKKPSSLEYPDYSSYAFPQSYILVNGQYEMNRTYWKHCKEAIEGTSDPVEYREWDEFLNEKYANDYNAVQRQYDNAVNAFVEAVNKSIDTYKQDYADWYQSEYIDKGFPKAGRLYYCPEDLPDAPDWDKNRAHWSDDYTSIKNYCDYYNSRTFLVGYSVGSNPDKIFTSSALSGTNEYSDYMCLPDDDDLKLYFCAPKGQSDYFLENIDYIRNQENYEDVFNSDLWFSVDVPKSGTKNCNISFCPGVSSSGVTILSQANIERLLNPRTIKVQAVELVNDQLRAENKLDVSVSINIGDKTFRSGQTYNNQTCPSDVDSATVLGNDAIEWVYVDNRARGILDKDAKVETFFVGLQRKNYIYEMTVKDDAGNPVKGADVKVIGKNYGSPLDSVTDKDGKIQIGREYSNLQGEKTISGGLTMQDYEVHVSAKGYGRQKIVIAKSDFPGSLSKEVTLTRQAQPSFIEEGTSMDRKGAFIPGVNFVGGSKNQVEFLTHTVLGGVLDNPLLMTLDTQIDTASGDSLQDVFLVDKKSFVKRDYSDKPKAVKVPSTAGDEYNPSEVLEWLEKLRSGELGNVYYKRFSEDGGFTFKNRTKDGGSHYELSSSIPLWELPPDGFEPCLIAVTGNDAVQIYHFDYSGEKEKEQLVGIRVLGDKAKVLNNITLMANAQAAGGSMVEHLMDIVSPTGSLLPLPQYEAGVTEEDGYLTYEYKLGIKLLQGKKDVSGADSAILSIAPTTLGIAIYGELGLTLNGEDRELSDSYNVTCAAEDMDLMDYLPPIFEALPVEISFDDGTPKGSFTLVDADKFNKKNETEEKSYEFSANAQVKVNAEVSAFKALGAVPTVGQVLLALEKSGALDVGAKLSLAAGADGTYRYKIIKGSGETEHEASFTVGIGAGIGLYAKAFGGSIGAEANLKVSGDNEKLEDMVTVTAEINKDGFNLKEVQGKLTADAHIAIETWFINGEKDFKFGEIPFKYEFNTETQFTLTPIKIKSTMRSRNDFETSTFNGRPETVVSNFLPIGSYATDDTDNGDFLYTDMSAKGGNVRLMLAPYSGSSAWTTPVNIASTDGLIPAFDIIKLADGKELAVWTEIPKAHMEKSCPPSVIKYSVGTITGGTWNGEVKTLAELSSEVASKLYLISDSKGVSLVALKTAEGALAERWSISGYTWNGTAWSAATSLAANQPLYDIKVTRADGKTFISYVTDDKKLHVKNWGDIVNESTFDVTGPETAIASDGTNVYLVSETAVKKEGSQTDASEPESNALMLRVYDGVWKSKGIIATTENPGNPSIVVGEDVNITYTADGDRALYVAECDKNGSITTEPEKVKEITGGRLDGSSIIATEDEQIVLTVFKAESDSEEDNSAEVDSLIAHITTTGKTAKIVTAPEAVTGITYDGKSHALVSAGSAKNGTMNYAVMTEEGAPSDNAYGTTIPAKTDAGTYYVWYKVTGNNGYADSAAMCKTVTIAKRGVMVTAKDQTVTYGDQIAQGSDYYDISATELVPIGEGGEAGSVLAQGDTETVTLTADKTTNKIQPAVTVKNGSKDVTANYDITQVAGILTVNKVMLTVKANDKTRTYGTDNPTFTYEVTGLKGNDKPEDVLVGSLACEAGKTTPAGGDGYEITKGNLRVADSFADCYDITFTAGTLTITRASQGAPDKGAGYVITGTTVTVDSESVHKIMSGDNVIIDYGTKYELYEYDGSAYTKGDSFTIKADKTYFVRWGEETNYSASAYTEINTTAGVTVMAVSASMGTVKAEGLSADGTCRIGSSVTVKASANDGNEFICWQDADGDTVSEKAEYTFTVTKDTVLVAAFKVKDKKTAVLPKTVDHTYDGTEKAGIDAVGEFTADGSMIGNGYILSGALKATDAGTYIVTATLADDYDMWADGTTAPKKLSWIISKKSQNAPNVSVKNTTIKVTIPQGKTVRYSADMTVDKANWTEAGSSIADVKAGTYYFYTVGDKNSLDSPVTVVTVARPSIGALTIQPSELTKNSATLNGAAIPEDYINSAYVESVKFSYREKGVNNWSETGSLTPRVTFVKEITGLKEDTDYEYRSVVVLKDDSQTAGENKIYGDSISFHTLKSANTGRVDVKVIDKNDVKRDVIVSIEAGNVVIAAIAPDAEGNVAFTNLPNGTYNVVVSSVNGDFLKTEMVEITGSKAVTKTFNIPAGRIASYIDVKNDDTPKIAVNGLDNTITAAEKDNAAAGIQQVEAKLEVEKVNEKKAQGSDEINELLDEGEKVDEFLNIGLFKTTKELDANGNATTIDNKDIGAENKEVLEIAIPYENIKTRNIRMYRYHNEVAEFLKELDSKPASYIDGTYYLDKVNGVIYLYASGFSTYAITTVDEGSETTATPTTTVKPTDEPGNPTASPTIPPSNPTNEPGNATASPTAEPTSAPTNEPGTPTNEPGNPTSAPTVDPGTNPTTPPDGQPTTVPSTVATPLPGAATTSPTGTQPGVTTPGATGTDPSQTEPTQTLSKITIKSVTCKKGTKKITVKLSVKGATVKIKVGKKAYKKATAKGKTYTLKLGSKLKKKTKVIIQVSKKNYASLKKSYAVK